MSESRNNSESRGSRYTSTYVSRASESRNNSESRCDSRGQVNNTRYNNLDDIDSLIEKLEREMPTITSNNPRINQALEQRRQKIEELKRLRDEARRESEEEKQLRMLEQSNDELDDIIGSVKKLVRKPSKPKNNSLILFAKSLRSTFSIISDKFPTLILNGCSSATPLFTTILHSF